MFYKIYVIYSFIANYFYTLTHSHEYGTIENTLEVLKIVQKGKLLDVIERFYIYKANKQKHHERTIRYRSKHIVRNAFEL
jgi:ABC-type microcin C transport system permease subunit YejB